MRFFYRSAAGVLLSISCSECSFAVKELRSSSSLPTPRPLNFYAFGTSWSVGVLSRICERRVLKAPFISPSAVQIKMRDCLWKKGISHG